MTTIRRSVYLVPFVALVIARTGTYATPLECHSPSGWYDASDIDDAANAIRSTTATGTPKAIPAAPPARLGRLVLLPPVDLLISAGVPSWSDPALRSPSPRAPPSR